MRSQSRLKRAAKRDPVGKRLRNERAAETRRPEAAAKALSSALGAKTAAEAGQGSRFASDGWSH